MISRISVCLIYVPIGQFSGPNDERGVFLYK